MRVSITFETGDLRPHDANWRREIHDTILAAEELLFGQIDVLPLGPPSPRFNGTVMVPTMLGTLTMRREPEYVPAKNPCPGNRTLEQSDCEYCTHGGCGECGEPKNICRCGKK